MRKKIMPLICLLSLLALMSNCKKDKSDSKCFELDGTNYETLQEAFNSIGDGQTAQIALLKDAEGDGAVLPEGKNAIIFLDFGEFCYELHEGKLIDLKNSDAIVSANGGAIKGANSFIKSEGGSLAFEGDLDLEVGIETASETDFEENFIGSFEGDLTVDGHDVYFMCPEATINIHRLTVKGENASVQILETLDGGMKIEKVISTLPHPVCAMNPDAATIGDGTPLHVHNFIQSEEEATCCTFKEITYTCSECGFSYEDADVEGGYGPCPIEDLIHYDEMPQGDTTFGYAEHWQCPHCGRAYANVNGSNDISGDYLLFPNNMEAGYPFISDFSDLELLNEGLDPFSIITGIITIVGFFSSTGMAIPGLIDNSYMWNDLNAKVDAVSEQIASVGSKIDALILEVKAIPAKSVIMERQEVFNYFTFNTMPTMISIDETLKSSSLSEQEKTEKIRQLVKTWAESGVMTYDLALNHMMQFYNTGIGSVPQLFEEFANASFLWENQGYPMRKQALIRDAVLSGCSFVLAYIYNKDIREESTIPGHNRQRYLEGMQRVLENYIATMKKDMYRMRVRNDALVKINMGGPNGTCFDKKMRYTDAYGHLNARWRDQKNCRFPRENQDNAAVRSTENFIIDCGGLPFTRFMAEAITTQYNAKHEQPLTDMWGYLINTIGFNRGETSSNFRIIVRENVASEYAFGHDGGDVSQPHCGPFYWRAYRLSGARDWFGVRSILRKNGKGTERLLVLPDCSISTYSSGHFKDFGNNSGNCLCSPASLVKEPADTVITIKPTF